jgi:hypothetical protein
MPYDNLNPSYRMEQAGYSPDYTGAASIPHFGLRGWSDEYLMGREKLAYQKDQDSRKWDMLNGLFGQANDMLGNFKASASRNPVPSHPWSMGYSPVYSQGQVDAMSNQQRANLGQQAAGQSADFAAGLGARGFSPLGPLAGMVSNQNQMRANAGAAEAETNLNFQAAKANSDARIATGGINQQAYGDWLKSMLGWSQMQQEGQFHQQQAGMDLLNHMFGALGTV